MYYLGHSIFFYAERINDYLNITAIIKKTFSIFLKLCTLVIVLFSATVLPLCLKTFSLLVLCWLTFSCTCLLFLTLWVIWVRFLLSFPVICNLGCESNASCWIQIYFKYMKVFCWTTLIGIRSHSREKKNAKAQNILTSDCSQNVASALIIILF